MTTRYAETGSSLRIMSVLRVADADFSFVKTLDTKYMESEWWAFKQLFDKGDVYRSYQIMPYSTALCTPLSNFEASLNYRDAQDPSLVISFPLLDQAEGEEADLLVWTTTPWTLPSNLAIAVNPDFEYLEILDESSGKRYYLLESGLSLLYKDVKKAKYLVLQRVSGHILLGWRYKPVFDYFTAQYTDCFRIIPASYVLADNGTGFVHIAPAFGPEDFEAATAAGIVNPSRLPPCPVDEKGYFTDQVPDYKGQYVRDTNKAIINRLREMDRLLVSGQVTRNVKFCWRSDTPLINKAISTWFIRVSDSVPQMLRNLELTTWVPSFVKEKRFANWLSNAKDWSVSRNRFFGTPLPLWVSDDYAEVVCVGSVEELKRLSGYEGELNDIHRDKVDHITIPSSQGKGALHRVEEVFDCW
jgi:isoleucyl-tRNA synthetase